MFTAKREKDKGRKTSACNPRYSTKPGKPQNGKNQIKAYPLIRAAFTGGGKTVNNKKWRGNK